MEPPNKVEADEIRAEKVKLLKAMTPIDKDNVAEQAVRVVAIDWLTAIQWLVTWKKRQCRR